MLQGRLFSYNDTHRHRLGANWDMIPVNCPYRSNTRNYQRDGPMNVNGNQEGSPNYFPNSFSGPNVDRRWKEHPTQIVGDVARWNSADEDDFIQDRAIKNFGTADAEFGRKIRELIET